MSVRLRVISLGAGVQSTTMALMAAHGEITPMPDCAIFADTRNEKRATYKHIDWLESVLPFSIIRIRRFEEYDSLGAATLAHYRGEARMPFTPPFHSPQGLLPNYCSKEWKTRAVIGKMRQMCGLKPGERAPKSLRAEAWLGFTTDEALRCKPCEASWITNRWPLIEQRRHRGECAPWLIRNGYPIPPRSACVFCAFQSDAEFATIDEEDRERANLFDEAIRNGGGDTAGPLYVSRHMRPLREIDFHAITASPQTDMFNNECEGMCGV